MDENLQEVEEVQQDDLPPLADRFVLEVGKDVVYVVDTEVFSTSADERIVHVYSGQDRLFNANAHVQALNDGGSPNHPSLAEVAVRRVKMLQDSLTRADVPGVLSLAEEVSAVEFLSETLPAYAREQHRASQLARVDDLMRVAVEQIGFYAGQLERATSLRARILKAGAGHASASLPPQEALGVPEAGGRSSSPENGSEAVVKDDDYWQSLADDVRPYLERARAGTSDAYWRSPLVPADDVRTS